MLINTIRDAYREMTGQMVAVEPIAVAPAHRTAANVSDIAKANVQARRHRRQRRLERAGRHSINGWTVRTW